MNPLTYSGSNKIITALVNAINYLIEHGGGGGGGMESTVSTLLASDWTGNSAPYEYDLGEDYEGIDVVIGYDASSLYSTAATMNAAANARIIGGEGTILYAYGTKPTVDIPVIIIYG